MPAVTPGDVLLIDKRYLPSIGHDKFVICICLSSDRFLFINSKPSCFADPSTQVRIIGKIELPFLDHTSFIDVANVHELPHKAIDHAVQGGGRRGSLSASLRERIKEAAKKAITLTTRDKETIINSL